MATTLLSQPDIAPHRRRARWSTATAGTSATCAISVTDRCDFRCVYCMAEDMKFLPKKEVLSFEEIDTIAARLRRARRAQDPADRRRAAGPARHHGAGREARRLHRARARRADADHQRQPARAATPSGLAAAGVRRINVSLDTLDESRFRDDHPPRPDRRRARRHRRRGGGRASRSRSTWSRCAASTTTRSSR